MSIHESYYERQARESLQDTIEKYANFASRESAILFMRELGEYIDSKIEAERLRQLKDE